jgi:hypothetical protein
LIVSINQPAYLPWLGYFDRIYQSDVHVVLDHVQFEKNSMVNRNKIRTITGTQMLTVPVCSAGKFGDIPINSIAIANQVKWNRKHWQAIMQSYSRAKYFDKYGVYFEEKFNENWDILNILLKDITSYLLDQLGINTTIIYSSEMDVSGKKDQLVLNICKELGASKYLSGPFGRDYLSSSDFSSARIALEYHDYKHPTYTQCYDGFEKGMSVLDLLFNHGSKSLEILTSADSISIR